MYILLLLTFLFCLYPITVRLIRVRIMYKHTINITCALGAVSAVYLIYCITRRNGHLHIIIERIRGTVLDLHIVRVDTCSPESPYIIANNSIPYHIEQRRGVRCY